MRVLLYSSGVEDASIKVRAYSETLYTQNVLGQRTGLPAYYQIEIRIKDGRVRVSSPYIEDTATLTMPLGNNEGAFRRIIKKWFKNGEIKPKELKNVTYVENQINRIVNSILGFSGFPSIVDDDW